MVAAERVSPHVSLIRGPIGTGFVAIYVVIGRRVALVDTGFVHHPGQAIAAGLSILGMSLADVDLVLTTHGHFDHAGGHAAVVAASGASVAIHPADQARLARRGATPRTDDEFAAAYRRVGRDDLAIEREALLLELTGPTIEPERLLADGDRIDLGAGVAVDVVATPGHTPGSVSFLVKPDRVAIVGDAIQGLGGSSGLPLYDDPDPYRASLDRLLECEAALIGLGHAFRSGQRAETWPIVPHAAIAPLLCESAAFPVIADQVAAEVIARPMPIRDAVEAFLAGLPAPFGGSPADLSVLGAASLHAAVLHLDRAATTSRAGPDDQRPGAWPSGTVRSGAR